jgi:creatinine amidohydrolase
MAVCLIGSLAAAASGATVEFEMLTWPELQRAIHQEGKTTVLVYNGGTEQRGPQDVAGGHTLMGRATVKAIAEKLGNAIAAPVMPFSVNNANANLPGTIGLTSSLFADLNQQVAEQLIQNGFRNVVLMGDHGGGQKELGEVARKLDRKYSSQGIRVIFCGDVYQKALDDFDRWLASNGYPPSEHAGIPDTSEMLYLGGGQGWVRTDLISSALGDPVPARGRPPERKINNGITGDARRSTAALGKRFFEMKVDYAVSQIQRLLGRK